MKSGKLSIPHRDAGALKERFKDCLRKSFGVSHRPSPMVLPSWESWRMTSHHQPHSVLLWKHPQGRSQGLKTHEEEPRFPTLCHQTCGRCEHISVCSPREPPPWSSFHEAKPWWRAGDEFSRAMNCPVIPCYRLVIGWYYGMSNQVELFYANVN